MLHRRLKEFHEDLEKKAMQPSREKGVTGTHSEEELPFCNTVSYYPIIGHRWLKENIAGERDT